VEDDRQPIQINLPEGSSLTDFGEQITEPYRRESYAKAIALTIVWMAFVSIILVLTGGFLVIYFSMSSPENSKQIIEGAVVPLLEKTATFFATVFSPLLAFILGYYFGQRQAQRRRTD
jgi:hypothetical protein